MTFDTNLKTSVENILAVKMTALVRKQSSLTPKLGGLGFRRRPRQLRLQCQLARGPLHFEGAVGPP